jgi:hypothetical protein
MGIHKHVPEPTGTQKAAATRPTVVAFSLGHEMDSLAAETPRQQTQAWPSRKDSSGEIEMPCSDGGPSREDIENERLRQRGLAVGLCIACSTLDMHGLLPQELRAWYEAHRAADVNRDLSEMAYDELLKADKVAQQAGYLGINSDHPLRRRFQEHYRNVDVSEKLERDESVKLSSLKPETR